MTVDVLKNLSRLYWFLLFVSIIFLVLQIFAGWSYVPFQIIFTMIFLSQALNELFKSRRSKDVFEKYFFEFTFCILLLVVIASILYCISVDFQKIYVNTLLLMMIMYFLAYRLYLKVVLPLAKNDVKASFLDKLIAEVEAKEKSNKKEFKKIVKKTIARKK